MLNKGNENNTTTLSLFDHSPESIGLTGSGVVSTTKKLLYIQRNDTLVANHIRIKKKKRKKENDFFSLYKLITWYMCRSLCIILKCKVHSVIDIPIYNYIYTVWKRKNSLIAYFNLHNCRAISVVQRVHNKLPISWPNYDNLVKSTMVCGRIELMVELANGGIDRPLGKIGNEDGQLV